MRNPAAMDHRRTALGIIEFLTLLYNCAAVKDVTHALFFTSSNDVISGGGVSSVSINYRQEGESSEMPFGYGCQKFGRSVMHSLRIKSMSFDPVSERVLLHITSKDDSRFTLARGWPCGAVPAANCSTPGQQTPTANDSLEFLYYDAKSLEHAKVGPFAYYNSTIYFLLQRFEKPDYRTKLNLIELRRLLSVCVDGTRLSYPVTATSSTFDIMDCSMLTAQAVEEQYGAYHSYRPLDALLVVPSKTPAATTTTLDFYFQLQHLENLTDTSLDISIILHHGSTKKSTTEPIHEQSVDSEYLKYVLLQLGGLSHRERYLCWAAIDRVMCGKLDASGRPSGIRTYLDVGQAAGVCRAPNGDLILRNIVTGVALASAEEGREMVIYFGCVAQVHGLGGAGLLRVPQSGVWPAYIAPLRRSDDERIRAGSMFLLDECREFTSPEVEEMHVVANRINIPTSLLTIILISFVCIALLTFMC